MPPLQHHKFQKSPGANRSLHRGESLRQHRNRNLGSSSANLDRILGIGGIISREGSGAVIRTGSQGLGQLICLDVIVRLDKSTVVDFLAAIIQGDAHNLSVFIAGSILDFESAFRIAGIKHRIDVDGDGHCTLFHDAVQLFLNLCLALAFELAKLCSDRIFQAVVGSSSIFIVPEEQTHAQEKQENHTNRNGPMQELVTTLLRIFFQGSSL